MHINAVGGDCPGKTELHRDILLRSDIFVEYPPQTRIEGEIQQLPPTTRSPSSGTCSPARRRAPRSAQITLFDSVGFAIEDFSALRYLRDQLRGPGFSRNSTCSPTLTIRATCSACCCGLRDDHSCSHRLTMVVDGFHSDFRFLRLTLT